MAPPIPFINGIVQSNNQISVDFIETHLDYAEHLPDGSLFDSEKGWFPGVSITGSSMTDSFVQHLYLWGQFSWINGKTDYFAPPVTSGHSGLDVKNVDFRIGKGFDVGPTTMLTPYLGAGWRDWHRDLTPLGPGGYKEDYTHGYVGAGLLFQWAPASRWVVSANGLVGSTFDPHIDVTLFPVPPANFGEGLGTKVIYMAGLAVDYAITNQWHANVGVDFTHFAYGAGPLLPPDGRNEPDSRTNLWTVKAGFGYSWGAPIVAKY